MVESRDDRETMAAGVAAGSCKLYMFYVGGNAGRSNIEVHDVQFVAVARVEDAYPALREAWFGDADKLHLDGYMAIDWADGYDVELAAAPCEGGQTLFFVNMGGYSRDTLAELHEFGLFVAASADEARSRAKRALLIGADLLHKDNLKDVDNCLALTSVGGFHLRLTANPGGVPSRPEWQGYRPIGIEAA
ncbi:DUF1543 domain-containing protein [Sphingomonas quercus]|uniref:DUF1543 domain-containing protein n=1 Tax=Sphingomonas quercus TaxID=2842451 RepID=A0ABS6BKL2_9SPHN|nr:DUF1543 domain-containing protein [Sphingomonas quercus]MBU3078838.1 DUF1543 domain-containing protein [Sphingomonas quercus]